MKKLSIVLMGIVIVLGIVVNVWSYTTWQEAYDNVMVKYNAKDYAGARTDLIQAVSLSTTDIQKTDTQLLFAKTYYAEKNYVTAITEFKKILVMHPYDKPDAQLFIGNCYLEQNDLVNSRLWYVVVLMGDYHAYQNEAFNKLISMKIDWNLIINDMGTPPTWTGYYYRAKAKQQLKDYTGGKADLLTAQNLCGNDKDAFKKCSELLEQINLQLKQSQ